MAPVTGLCGAQHTEDLDKPGACLDEAYGECLKHSDDASSRGAAIAKKPEACAAAKSEAIAVYSEQIIADEQTPEALHPFAVAQETKVSSIRPHRLAGCWSPEVGRSSITSTGLSFDWAKTAPPVGCSRRDRSLWPYYHWSAMCYDKLRQRGAASIGQTNQAGTKVGDTFRRLALWPNDVCWSTWADLTAETGIKSKS